MMEKLKFFFFNLDALVLLIIDQIIKNFLRQHPDYLRDFFIFKIHFWQNPGIAFGLRINQTIIAVLISLIIIILVYYLLQQYQKRSFWLVFCLTLIIYGALSNLIDRFLVGAVIDYLDLNLIPWPIFNLADLMVIGGILGWLILIIKNRPRLKKV